MADRYMVCLRKGRALKGRIGPFSKEEAIAQAQPFANVAAPGVKVTVEPLTGAALPRKRPVYLNPRKKNGEQHGLSLTQRIAFLAVHRAVNAGEPSNASGIRKMWKKGWTDKPPRSLVTTLKSLVKKGLIYEEQGYYALNPEGYELLKKGVRDNPKRRARKTNPHWTKKGNHEEGFTQEGTYSIEKDDHVPPGMLKKDHRPWVLYLRRRTPGAASELLGRFRTNALAKQAAANKALTVRNPRKKNHDFPFYVRFDESVSSMYDATSTKTFYAPASSKADAALITRWFKHVGKKRVRTTTMEPAGGTRVHAPEPSRINAMLKHAMKGNPGKKNPRAKKAPASRRRNAAMWAQSKERYNGGAAIKRQYGSSTVTVFWVGFKGDEKTPSKWVVAKGYGKTPGERKTDAMKRALPQLQKLASGHKPLYWMSNQRGLNSVEYMAKAADGGSYRITDVPGRSTVYLEYLAPSGGRTNLGSANSISAAYALAEAREAKT